jgi:hypothetical protein
MNEFEQDYQRYDLCDRDKIYTPTMADMDDIYAQFLSKEIGDIATVTRQIKPSVYDGE